MNDYVIMTDSCCDLPAELISKLNLCVLPLSFTLEDERYFNYPDWRDMSPKAFYDKMRAGKISQTSAVNVSAFYDAMEEYAKKGVDVLYIGFSSALSGTYGFGVNAVTELKQSFPERRFLTIDSLSASLGYGLLVYLAAAEKEKGASLDELYEYVEKTKLSIAHWFTVDDLHALKRGGRVSAASAIIGTVLGIKPVLHTDDEGKLTFVESVRGRKSAFRALIERMKQTAIEPEKQTVFICHGDCEDEAKRVAELITEACGTTNFIIGHVGPVIGSHTGAGVISIFFIATQR